MENARDALVARMKDYVQTCKVRSVQLANQVQAVVWDTNQQTQHLKTQLHAVAQEQHCFSEKLSCLFDDLTKCVVCVCAETANKRSDTSYEQLQRQNQLLEQAIQDLHAKIENLERERLHSNAMIAKQQAEISHYVRQAEEQAIFHQRELAESRAVLEEVSITKDSQIEDLNKQLNVQSKQLEAQVSQQQSLLQHNQDHISVLERQVSLLQHQTTNINDSGTVAGGISECADRCQACASQQLISVVEQQQQLINSLCGALNRQNERLLTQQAKVGEVAEQLAKSTCLNENPVIAENERLKAEIQELRTSNLQLSQQSDTETYSNLLAAVESSFQMLENKDETIVKLNEMLQRAYEQTGSQM